MQKTVHVEKTDTTFFLPARDVLAVRNAASSDHTRFYLNGIYVEEHCHDGIQIVATDGHVLLRKPADDEAFMGAGVTTQGDTLTRGFILALDTADKAVKAKTQGEPWLYGDTDTGIVQVLDVRGDDTDGHARVGVLEFSRIDGTFPDWRRVMPKVEPGEAGAPVCIDIDLLVRMQKAAKVYARSAHVRITAGGAGEPMLIEFGPSCGGMQGVVMPLRWDNAT